MRIGIVGTGNMGRSLGALWAERGHDVLFGAREVGKAMAAAELAGCGARAGGNDDAAAFGDVLLWGVRDVPAAEVLSDLRVLDGKVVLDPNNRPTPTDFTMGPRDGVSHAERLQRQLPHARVVKAFNTMAQEVFELSPEPLRAHEVSVFLAGDDADAKRVAADLTREIGFVPLDPWPSGCGAAGGGHGRFHPLRDGCRPPRSNGDRVGHCAAAPGRPAAGRTPAVELAVGLGGQDRSGLANSTTTRARARQCAAGGLKWLKHLG